MANLNLTDVELSQLLNKAIIDSLGEDGRQRIVEMAMKFLTTDPPCDSYGRSRPSPLKEIIHDAVRDMARTHCRALIENDPGFQAQITSIFSDASAKMFAGEQREKLVEAFYGALWKTFDR